MRGLKVSVASALGASVLGAMVVLAPAASAAPKPDNCWGGYTLASPDVEIVGKNGDRNCFSGSGELSLTDNQAYAQAVIARAYKTVVTVEGQSKPVELRPGSAPLRPGGKKIIKLAIVR